MDTMNESLKKNLLKFIFTIRPTNNLNITTIYKTFLDNSWFRKLTELFFMNAATMVKLLTIPKTAMKANTTDVTFHIISGKSGHVLYISSIQSIRNMNDFLSINHIFDYLIFNQSNRIIVGLNITCCPDFFDNWLIWHDLQIWIFEIWYFHYHEVFFYDIWL